MRTRYLLLVLLSVAGCQPSHDPQHDTPDGGPGCRLLPRAPLCEEPIPDVLADLPSLPADRVEGAYAGHEGSALLLDVEGSTLSIDSPGTERLAAWLPIGERLIATRDQDRGVLRIGRASDGALLFAMVRNRMGAPTSDVLDRLEGLGVTSTERRTTCGFLREVGFGCLAMPMLAQELTLETGVGGATVLARGETVTLETATGRFELTHLASDAMDLDPALEGECAICGVFIGTRTYVDVVRAE